MLASEDAFVDRIDAYVDARDFTSALWWSERIYAAAPSIENLLRLAQIHLQSNKPCRTYGLLKGYQAQIDPRNEDSLRLDRRRRFLFAQACFELGQFRDAEISLIEGFSGTNPSAMDINLMPNGASGFHLLGQICMKQNRRCQALAYFQRCIEMDSFHWSAYAAMCQMGAALPNSCRLEIQECESIVPSEPLAAPFAPKPAFLASQPLTPGATQFSAPYQTPSAPIGFLTPQTNLPKPSFSSICVETPPLKTEVKVGTTPFRKPPLGSIRKVHSRLGRDATPVTKTPRRSERLSFSTLTDLTSDPDRAQRSSRRSARLEKRITDRGSSVNHPGQNGAMSRSCLKALSHAVTTTTEAYRLLCNFQCNEVFFSKSSSTLHLHLQRRFTRLSNFN
uniref:Uncharacterized protein n=1 Tax=Spongospora subterranea TaxID=70186 RepID=A0A0H5R879_9EUKA|eukprot:CRZ04522.1 hypothetical protein [Spongospora subterranea]